MSRSEVLIKYGIDKTYKQAVLRREEVKRPYIVIDNLMHNCEMEQYTEFVKNRILDMEGVEYLLEEEHLDCDILNGLIRLDEVAFLSCSNIIKGYVEDSKYQAYLELLQATNYRVRVTNKMIKFYRSKSLGELIKGYLEHRRMKAYDKDIRELKQGVLECYKLELISRIPLVRLYHKLYYWSCKIAAKAIYCIISRKIKVNHAIESRKRGK